MQKITDFFKEGIWLIPLDPEKPLQSFLVRSARILVGSIQGFVKDECYLKASALTFYTLLSIIPVFAVAFGIAKGFGFEAGLQHEVEVRFHDQPELANAIIKFAYSLLGQAQGGLIAAIGSVFLLWSVLKLLGNIEHSLNAIWKVPNSRHFLRQFSDYLAILILCPIFFVASSSLTIMITTEIRSLAEQSSIVDAVRPTIFFLFRFIPYISSWILFTLLYLLMPNTRVNIKAGILAGVIAGTVYQIVQWVYIYFQIGVASYGAIYGSFAALPLLLLWIHFSWLIVLTGAEIAYTTECEQTATARPSPRILASGRALGLAIAYHCVRNFQEGSGPTHIATIARELGIPVNKARTSAEQLVDAGLLSAVRNGHVDELYQPARDIGSITIQTVCDAIDESSKKTISIHASSEYRLVQSALEAYDDSRSKCKANRSLLTLGDPT